LYAFIGVGWVKANLSFDELPRQIVTCHKITTGLDCLLLTMRSIEHI
jgi:hypothetical protein